MESWFLYYDSFSLFLTMNIRRFLLDILLYLEKKKQSKFKFWYHYKSDSGTRTDNLIKPIALFASLQDKLSNFLNTLNLTTCKVRDFFYFFFFPARANKTDLKFMRFIFVGAQTSAAPVDFCVLTF